MKDNREIPLLTRDEREQEALLTRDERKAQREQEAIQAYAASRAGRRARRRARLSRQAKHNRLFQRTQRQEAYAKETAAAQLAVLEAGPEHPMYRNVYNALAAQHATAAHAE